MRPAGHPTEEEAMHARAVRFTGVNQETIDKVRAQVDSSDGPPPGVRATGMKMLFDAEQGTSLFIAFFENEQDMRDADRIFDEMDPGDTPGDRASVDRCEVVIEREA
jgi:hypothetical protein